jgi:2'-5' RNA ligase
MVERLFFALWPTPAVRAGLIDARAQLPGAPGRLTHPADLHLTLVFVGAAEDPLRPCIAAAGDDVALDGFSLRLDALTGWRRPGLWVAQPSAPVDELLNLVSQLQRNLLVCGVEPEKRPFRAHVTLARKAPAIAPQVLSLDWVVSDFVLAASRSARAPAYRILRRWPLG